MFEKVCLALYGVCLIVGNVFVELGFIFVVLAILMSADSVLGALKYWRVKQFSSRELKWGVLSKVLAVVIIVLIHLGLEAGNLSGELFTKSALILLIVAELISLIQNWIVIKTGEKMEEQDAITEVMRWVLAKIQSIMKLLTNQK